MIASIDGTVTVRGADHVVLECTGVGYRLALSSQTLRRVPPVGGNARLHAHLILRDDGMHLYGFATEDERQLFLQLISVAGVGPKMALALLSGSSAAELRRAIAAGDSKRFQVVPGVGRKTAERVIVELREKIADGLAVAPAGENGSGDARALARDGLVGLGYDASEAQEMLDRIDSGNGVDAPPEDLIAAALRRSVKVEG
jgi:Holliday junction DNA helicase RuvA